MMAGPIRLARKYPPILDVRKDLLARGRISLRIVTTLVFAGELVVDLWRP